MVLLDGTSVRKRDAKHKMKFKSANVPRAAALELLVASGARLVPEVRANARPGCIMRSLWGNRSVRPNLGRTTDIWDMNKPPTHARCALLHVSADPRLVVLFCGRASCESTPPLYSPEALYAPEVALLLARVRLTKKRPPPAQCCSHVQPRQWQIAVVLTELLCGKLRISLGLVDLSRTTRGAFVREVHPGSEMARKTDKKTNKDGGDPRQQSGNFTFCSRPRGGKKSQKNFRAPREIMAA